MQRCLFCGFEFPDNTRFCGNCGQASTSLAAPDPASRPIASPPKVYMNTIANTPFPQGNQPNDEERRRRAILPVPLPFGMDGLPAGGQVPIVQGTPSFGGVPYVPGTTPGMAGSMPLSNFAASVPSAAPSAGQPAGIGNQPPPWTSQPAPYPTHPTGIPDHKPPEQDHPGKHHHELREHHQHQNTLGASTVSKGSTGGITKVILIVTIGVVVVAIGSSALVFALRSHIPGLASIIAATSSSSTIKSNPNANACAVLPGTPCVGTTSLTSPVAGGESTGTFSFSGAVSGVMVITSFPACAVIQGNTYSLQVIGTIGGTQYKFIIGILSYKGPGTYTSQLTVNLIRGSGTDVGELSNDGRLPVRISITNGGKAGTVNSDLEGILKLSDGQLSKGHISASWTCG
jgi:hypothetical protein